MSTLHALVLINVTERSLDPTALAVEAATVSARGRDAHQVIRADGSSASIDSGLVAIEQGVVGGCRLYLTDVFPDERDRLLWLGVQCDGEPLRAAWIPAQHGALVHTFPDAALPGAVFGVRTHRSACPGAWRWTLFSADSRLVELATTFSSGEAGWYSEETLSIPTRRSGGRVEAVSVEDGEVYGWGTAGELLIWREVGEPTEEGAYTSRVVRQSVERLRVDL